MESKDQRLSSQWFVDYKKNKDMQASPADYDPTRFQKKESFNTGTVPFGSGSKQQNMYKSRVTQLSPTNLITPGPGSYSQVKSSLKSVQVNGRNSQKTSFGTSGISKQSGSASRIMAHQNSNTSTKVTNNDFLIKNGSTDLKELQGQMSCVSLRRNQSPSHANQNSTADLVKHRLKNIDSITNLEPLKVLLHEQSITKLTNSELAFDQGSVDQMRSKYSNDQQNHSNLLSTSLIAKTQPQNNQQSSMKKLSQSPSKLRMVNNAIRTQQASNQSQASILGTMGIPRELSNNRKDSNFLFTSNNIIGPGDYDAKDSLTKSKSPVISFSVTGTKSNQQQKSQIESYLKMFADQNQSKTAEIRKEYPKALQNYEASLRNKQSFMFQSSTKKIENVKDLTPGPGAYSSQMYTTDIAVRADKSKQIKPIVEPKIKPRQTSVGVLRNPMMPFTNPSNLDTPAPNSYSVNQSMDKLSKTQGINSLKNSVSRQNLKKIITTDILSSNGQNSALVTQSVSTKAKQFGLNMIVANKQDPQNLSNNEFTKAEIHKRSSQPNVGPGSYNINGKFEAKDEDEEFVKKAAFNTSAPRFKSHARAKTIEDTNLNKPVYELQQLEGPQIKASRLLNESDNQSIDLRKKAQLAQGSVFKSNQPRNVKAPDLKQMIENSEYNAFHSESHQQYKDKLKQELKSFILQEEQLVSFASSSPRFQQLNQIKVLPGRDSISGVNYKVKENKSIGPGSYTDMRNTIELNQKQISLKNNLSKAPAFSSNDNRNQHDFQAQQQKSRAYQGKSGQYHQDSSLIKKTFNANLQGKQ